MIITVTVFLCVASVGVATSYRRDAQHLEFDAAGANAYSLPHSGPEENAVDRLANYLRSIGDEAPPPAKAASALLPDVDTMIQRLAVRLKSAPGDVQGWRMLGWSYFNTARYNEAAAAYAKAMALDPSSQELKSAYEQANTLAQNRGEQLPD